jgi:hypothetical protein
MLFTDAAPGGTSRPGVLFRDSLKAFMFGVTCMAAAFVSVHSLIDAARAQ